MREAPGPGRDRRNAVPGAGRLASRGLRDHAALLLSEESTENRMHLDHLFLPNLLVEPDHDTHREQHPGPRGLPHRSDHVGHRRQEAHEGGAQDRDLGLLLASYGRESLRATIAIDELRQSEEKFRTITASAQDAIIMMDAFGKISYWNEAAELIFGWSNEEILGKEIFTFLVLEEDQESYMRLIEKGEVTGVAAPLDKPLTLKASRKDGSELPIELSLSRFQLKEQWNVVAIIRDITERVAAEEEKDQLQAELLQAQKMEAIGTLAGGIAHDFNNILMGIQGRTSLMLINTTTAHPHFEHSQILAIDRIQIGRYLY